MENIVNDANYWFNKGYEFCNSGNFEEAIKCYNEATEFDENFADAFNNCGWCLHNLAIIKAEETLLDEAFYKFDKATQVCPDYALAYYNWGQALYHLAIIKGNERLFKENIGKYNAETLYKWINDLLNYTKFQADERLFEEVFDKYNKAILSDANYIWAYCEWGWALYYLAIIKNDEILLEKSLKQYTKAIELDSNHANAFTGQGNIFSQLSKIKGNEKFSWKAINKFAQATTLNPDFEVTFNNWGNTLRNLAITEEDKNLFIDAINIYSKAIAVNNQYAIAFYNIALSYYQLEKFAEGFTYMNTYLYLSIKQKGMVHIQEMLDVFKDHPQNIITLYEKLNIDVTTHLFDNYTPAKYKVSDFTDWMSYLKNCSVMNWRELLGVKAILYYYLGGLVESFLIFDEELNYKTMTSQELYYFVKVAFDIRVDSQKILDDAIWQLENRVKDSIDCYYLGHLFLIANNNEQAKKYFKLSQESFAEIMLHFLDDTEIQDYLNFNKLMLQGEINYTGDLTQFQDFFHVAECQDALSMSIIFEQETYEPCIWKAFYLSKEAKKIINKQQSEFSAGKVKTEILIQWEYQIKNSSKKEINARIKQIEKYIKIESEHDSDNSDNVEKTFKKINKKANEKFSKNDENLSNYEEILSLYIHDQKLNAKDYLIFILYFFLDEKISAEETFYLLFYLKCKMSDKFRKDILYLIDKYGINIVPKIETPIRIIKLGFELYKLNNKLPSINEAFDENQSKLDEYTRFKKTCWKLFFIEYHAIGKEKFKEQYKLQI